MLREDASARVEQRTAKRPIGIRLLDWALAGLWFLAGGVLLAAIF